MTIPEAAPLVNMTPEAIRGWILNGNCPFGYCIRSKKNRYGRNSYVIIERQLFDFLEGNNVFVCRDGNSNMFNSR